jgi:hypothetical protein
VNQPRPPPPQLVRRRRLQLVALAALFVGPLALSALLYFGSGLRPSGRVQHGELLEPARPLPTATLATAAGTVTAPDFLRHKWSLLTVARGGCAARCVDALEAARVARLALDQDAPRVQRILLADAGCCEAALRGAAGDGLVTAWLDANDGQRLLAALATRAAPSPEAGRLYLIDPLGNLVMSYAPGTGPKDLLQDLGRLLRLSRIG